MPHQIRLRDWAAAPPPAEMAQAVERHFNRPTGLTGCTVYLRTMQPRPDHAELNGTALDACPSDSARLAGCWRIDVAALDVRNQLRLAWSSEPPVAASAMVALLEIYEPDEPMETA